MAFQKYTDEQVFEQGLGQYYASVPLDDIINNFIFAYTGAGKVLTNVNRSEVVFWAQRTVQEFAYDITRSNTVAELEYNPDTLTARLPADLINLQKVTVALNNGEELILQRMQEHEYSGNTPLTDENYEPLFDDRGEEITTTESGSRQFFQHPQDIQQRDLIEDLFWSDYYFDNDYEYGRRFGISPNRANLNPKFYVSLEEGLIYFNDAITRVESGNPIPKIYYITDGLRNSEDLSTVVIPKLAEDAVYENLLYQLCRLRPDTAAAAAAYEKSARAKKRNAKIRLQGYQNIDWQQLMKQKSKWIKY